MRGTACILVLVAALLVGAGCGTAVQQVASPSPSPSPSPSSMFGFSADELAYFADIEGAFTTVTDDMMGTATRLNKAPDWTLADGASIEDDRDEVAMIVAQWQERETPSDRLASLHRMWQRFMLLVDEFERQVMEAVDYHDLGTASAAADLFNGSITDGLDELTAEMERVRDLYGE